MKSQIEFLQMILTDVSIRCSTSTHRDLETISRRFEHEGYAFLAITLPDFCNDFHKSLADELVNPSLFPSFRKRGQLPVFLGGLMDQVFDRWSGRLLNEPSIAAIQAIRQITLSYSKTEERCSEERISDAIDSYIQCEQDVLAVDDSRSFKDYEDFERMSFLIWRDLNVALDRRIYCNELVPAHGPGMTADKLIGNQKFTLNEWTLRMENAGLRYSELASSSYLDYMSRVDHVNFLEPEAERPVKVVHVSKTLKAPRIIAMEPTCMMFVQQGIMSLMCEEFLVNPNARNFIEFSSQLPNQLLAREGSLTGELATLDLKEASDRVSNELVRSMFNRFPYLREAVDVVRSRTADVPGHGVIRLAKYASMGSALTFPLEAMVFCTLVFLGIESELKRKLTQEDLMALYGKVRVYGDDIVVPVEYVGSVIRTLEHFGAVVNRRKSFWTGKFRESCGGDYYAGKPVMVARVRRNFPKSRRDGNKVISLVSLRNQLFELGYEITVEYLDRILESKELLGKHYPRVMPNSPILGRWTHAGSYDIGMIHEWEQRPMVKGYVAIPRIPKNEIDGYAALHKVLVKRTNTPFEDTKHLIHSGRAISVDIKLKWASPL